MARRRPTQRPISDRDPFDDEGEELFDAVSPFNVGRLHFGPAGGSGAASSALLGDSGHFGGGVGSGAVRLGNAFGQSGPPPSTVRPVRRRRPAVAGLRSPPRTASRPDESFAGGRRRGRRRSSPNPHQAAVPVSGGANVFGGVDLVSSLQMRRREREAAAAAAAAGRTGTAGGPRERNEAEEAQILMRNMVLMGRASLSPSPPSSRRGKGSRVALPPGRVGGQQQAPPRPGGGFFDRLHGSDGNSLNHGGGLTDRGIRELAAADADDYHYADEQYLSADDSLDEFLLLENALASGDHRPSARTGPRARRPSYDQFGPHGDFISSGDRDRDRDRGGGGDGDGDGWDTVSDVPEAPPEPRPRSPPPTLQTGLYRRSPTLGAGSLRSRVPEPSPGEARSLPDRDLDLSAYGRHSRAYHSPPPPRSRAGHAGENHGLFQSSNGGGSPHNRSLGYQAGIDLLVQMREKKHQLMALLRTQAEARDDDSPALLGAASVAGTSRQPSVSDSYSRLGSDPFVVRKEMPTASLQTAGRSVGHVGNSRQANAVAPSPPTFSNGWTSPPPLPGRRPPGSLSPAVEAASSSARVSPRTPVMAASLQGSGEGSASGERFTVPVLSPNHDRLRSTTRGRFSLNQGEVRAEIMHAPAPPPAPQPSKGLPAARSVGHPGPLGSSHTGQVVSTTRTDIASARRPLPPRASGPLASSQQAAKLRGSDLATNLVGDSPAPVPSRPWVGESPTARRSVQSSPLRTGDLAGPVENPADVARSPEALARDAEIAMLGADLTQFLSSMSRLVGAPPPPSSPPFAHGQTGGDYDSSAGSALARSVTFSRVETVYRPGRFAGEPSPRSSGAETTLSSSIGSDSKADEGRRGSGGDDGVKASNNRTSGSSSSSSFSFDGLSGSVSPRKQVRSGGGPRDGDGGRIGDADSRALSEFGAGGSPSADAISRMFAMADRVRATAAAATGSDEPDFDASALGDLTVTSWRDDTGSRVRVAEVSPAKGAVRTGGRRRVVASGGDDVVVTIRSTR